MLLGHMIIVLRRGMGHQQNVSKANWCGQHHLSFLNFRDFLLATRKRDLLLLTHTFTMSQTFCGVEKLSINFVSSSTSMSAFSKDLTLKPRDQLESNLQKSAANVEDNLNFPMTSLRWFLFKLQGFLFCVVDLQINDSAIFMSFHGSWRIVEQHIKCEMSTLILNSQFRAYNEDFIGFYSGCLLLVVHWKSEFKSFCILFLLMTVCPVSTWNISITYKNILNKAGLSLACEKIVAFMLNSLIL